MLARDFFFQLGSHIYQDFLPLLVSWYFDEDFDFIFSDIYHALLGTAIKTAIDWVIGGNRLVVNGGDLLRLLSLCQEVTELEGVVDRFEIVEEIIKSNTIQDFKRNGCKQSTE